MLHVKYTTMLVLPRACWGILVGWAVWRVVLATLPLPVQASVASAAIICISAGVMVSCSSSARCISFLLFPRLATKAGRTLMRSAVLASIIAGPVHNLLLNAAEVSRVVTCCNDLGGRLVGARARLALQPLLAARKAPIDNQLLQHHARSVRDMLSPIADEMGVRHHGRPEVAASKTSTPRPVTNISGSEPLQAGQEEAAGFVYTSLYRQKLQRRCKDVFQKAESRCEGGLGRAFHSCVASVSFMLSGLLCQMSLLSNLCRLLPSAGECHIGNKLDPGLGSGYLDLQRASQDLEKELRPVRILTRVEPQRSSLPQLITRNYTGVKEHISNIQHTLSVVLQMVHMLTGFLFLLVLLSALRYLQHYTLDVRHDNIWIGQHFKQLKPDLLPLNKIERAWLSDVWSLSCFPGISWTGILKLLLETLLVSVLVALDVLLWSALSSVARHARLDYTQTGQHDLRLEVAGAGLVAGLVRGLLAGLSSSSALLSHTSSLACLPLPTAPLTQHVWRIYCGQGLLLLLLLLNSYVARSSRAVCAYYFPDRESSRAVYLHTQVLRERKRLFLSQNLRSRTAQECWLPRWLLTRCPVLANVLPKTCSVCQDSTWRPQASGFMCCPASSCGAVCCASCSSWLAATCWRCPDNLVACGDMLISDAME